MGEKIIECNDCKSTHAGRCGVSVSPYLDGFADARASVSAYLLGRANGLRSRGLGYQADDIDRVREELVNLLTVDDR